MSISRKTLPIKKTLDTLPTKPASDIATTTVHQHRLPVFSHKNQLSDNDMATKKRHISIENKYGIITFTKGRLSELHCRILEILLSNKEKYGTHISTHEDKEYRTCEFTAYQLLKDLKCGGQTREWLLAELTEMASSYFRITSKKGFYDKDYTGITMSVLFAFEDDFNKGPTSDKIKIHFNPIFMDLWLKDINVFTNKTTKLILELDQAWIRQIVRFVETHEAFNESLHEVFFSVGIVCEKHAKRLHPEIDLKNLNIISLRAYNEYRRKFTMRETIESLANVFGEDKGIRVKWSDEHEDYILFYKRKKDSDDLVWSQRPLIIEKDSFKVEIKNLGIGLETQVDQAIKAYDLEKARIEALMKKENRVRCTQKEDEILEELVHKAEQLSFQLEKQKKFEDNEKKIKAMKMA